MFLLAQVITTFNKCQLEVVETTQLTKCFYNVCTTMLIHKTLLKCFFQVAIRHILVMVGRRCFNNIFFLIGWPPTFLKPIKNVFKTMCVCWVCHVQLWRDKVSKEVAFIIKDENIPTNFPFNLPITVSETALIQKTKHSEKVLIMTIFTQKCTTILAYNFTASYLCFATLFLPSRSGPGTQAR